MNSFLAVSVLLAVSLASPSKFQDSNEDWDRFKSLYGKFYGSAEEELFRRRVFLQTKSEIEEHNARFQKGLVTYAMEMNQFGDMLSDEVVPIFNLDHDQYKSCANKFIPKKTSLPLAIDWREKGAVTKVKNQGTCGACWAFSTTGSIEGQHSIKTGKLVSLSEQQLIDCAISGVNKGCISGQRDEAYRYLLRNGGLDTEKSYPFEEKANGYCGFKRSSVAVTIVNYVDIPAGSESALQEAVANVGPVAVNVDASRKSFQQYHHGVYDEPACSNSSLFHAMLIVGYDEFEGTPYWIVKNSWGPKWGRGGYIWMKRNAKNQCGIASDAAYPIV